MKIIKIPKFDICECKRCGTVFQPEKGDQFMYQYNADNPFDVRGVCVRCPICDLCVEVKTKDDEKGGERYGGIW